MSCLLSTGGLHCEDSDMIKMHILVGAECRRKDTHCCNYVGLFINYLGKMGVCLFFLVFQSREHSLNHHAVIIARKKITKVHLTPERLCLLFLQRSMCTSTAFGWPILFPTFFFFQKTNKQIFLLAHPSYLNN